MARGRPVFTLPNFRAVQAARHDAHSSTMAAPEQQQEKKRTGSCLGRTVGSLIDGGVFGGAIGSLMATGPAFSQGLFNGGLRILLRSGLQS